jgi:hypothetical protein
MRFKKKKKKKKYNPEEGSNAVLIDSTDISSPDHDI